MYDAMFRKHNCDLLNRVDYYYYFILALSGAVFYYMYQCCVGLVGTWLRHLPLIIGVTSCFWGLLLLLARLYS